MERILMHAHSSHAVENGQAPRGISPEARVGATAADESSQYVAFSSGGRAYAVDIMSVQEIRSWSPTSEIPDQHHAAVGVMDIRGEVIQVLDLSAILGGIRTEITEGHVILVLSINGETAGILVDSVSDIIQVNNKDLRPPPGSRKSGNSGVVRAVVKQDDTIVAILDLSKVIGSEL
jgi:purine-binding chemotaxis protein CheW